MTGDVFLGAEWCDLVMFDLRRRPGRARPARPVWHELGLDYHGEPRGPLT